MTLGRPPKWSDPEAFEKAVDEYFANEPQPTWTGLALHLGYESRQSLWEASKKDGFSLPVKKALTRIENQYERGLFGKNPAGSIFALKNFQWKDKQEVEQSGGVTIRFEEPEEYKRVYPTQDQGNIPDLDSDQPGV